MPLDFSAFSMPNLSNKERALALYNGVHGTRHRLLPSFFEPYESFTEFTIGLPFSTIGMALSGLFGAMLSSLKLASHCLDASIDLFKLDLSGVALNCYDSFIDAVKLTQFLLYAAYLPLKGLTVHTTRLLATCDSALKKSAEYFKRSDLTNNSLEDIKVATAIL